MNSPQIQAKPTPELYRWRWPVLRRAVAFWRPEFWDAASNSLIDLSGNGLHARSGSAGTPNTNDPLRLAYNNSKYAYFPGSLGNYLSAPDSVSMSITGDLDLRALVAADYTPAFVQTLISKRSASSGEYSWRINTTGTMAIFWYAAGLIQGPFDSTASIPTADNTGVWLRATRSSTEVKFYTSSDGVMWTQLGATINCSAASLATDTGNAVAIGARADGSDLFSGKIYRAQILAGINGAIMADFNAGQLTEPYASHVDPHGNVWTFNRSAAGRKLCVVDRNLFLLGTDDYFEVADNALIDFAANEDMSIVIALRHYPTQTNVVFAAKRTFTNYGGAVEPGYVLRRDTAASIFISDGGEVGTIGAIVVDAGNVFGIASILSGVRTNLTRDGRLQSDTLNLTGTRASATAGSLTNARALCIGRLSTSAPYADFEFFGAAVFREALTADQLTKLVKEFSL